MLDWKRLRSIVQEDEELLREVVLSFLNESPTMIDNLHKAIEQRDAARLRLTLHTVAGSMRILGSDRSREIAAILEERASREVWQDADGLTQQLVTEIEGLCHEIARYLE